MYLVIEGPDNVGKTTYINSPEFEGYVKLVEGPQFELGRWALVEAYDDYRIAEIAPKLYRMRHYTNIVQDRSFVSTMAYQLHYSERKDYLDKLMKYFPILIPDKVIILDRKPEMVEAACTKEKVPYIPSMMDAYMDCANLLEKAGVDVEIKYVSD